MRGVLYCGIQPPAPNGESKVKNQFFATLFLLIAIINGALFVAWLARHNILEMALSGSICVLFSFMCMLQVFAEIRGDVR